MTPKIAFPVPFRPLARALLLCSLAMLLTASAPTPPAAATAPQAPSTTALVDRAVEAIGGEAALRALTRARSRGRTHAWALEQSERPEGPWIVQYGEFEEWVELDRPRLRADEVMISAQFPDGSAYTRIYADGNLAIARGERTSPGFPALISSTEERLALGPVAVLLTARSASPGTPEATLHESVPHWRVPFEWRDGRVELSLNATSGLPSAVRLIRAYPDDSLLGMWGEVVTETRFHYWKLHPGGWRYPHQWDSFRNGQPLETRMVLEVEPAAELSEESFAIPAEVVAMVGQLTATTRRNLAPGAQTDPVEIAPGVILYPGWWNVMLVEQHDGVVVVEGPISSEYSEKVIEEAAERFPGKPIKAVINTSDAWPHIGGLRTYAARGVPIYSQSRNAPLLGRLMAAPYASAPDALELDPRPARFEWIDGARRIASSRNPIVVAPIDGEWSDRMLMVWLPELKLVWGGDLIFPPGQGRDGYFMPGYLEELRAAARREGFEPEQLVAMHAGPLPWRAIVEEIERVRAMDPTGG